MKRAVVVVDIMIFFCFILIVSPSKTYSSELEINFHRQNTVVWCWAATIAMVVEYVKGENIEDCEVLSRYDRSLGGPGNCCYGDRRCIRTGQISEMGQILGNIFNIRGRYISKPPSFQELKNSINNDNPIIATLQHPRGSGHVVVVSGYQNPNRVVVLDPMHGKHIVNYNTLIANFEYGYWTGSFLLTSENSQSNSKKRIRMNLLADWVKCMNGSHSFREGDSIVTSIVKSHIDDRMKYFMHSKTTVDKELIHESKVVFGYNDIRNIQYYYDQEQHYHFIIITMKSNLYEVTGAIYNPLKRNKQYYGKHLYKECWPLMKRMADFWKTP